jgi:hypothetical protein
MAMPGYKAAGYVQLRYPKVDLSSLFNGIVPELTGVSKPTLHDLLPDLNRKLGLSLSPMDIRNVTLSWLGDGERINISVRSTKTSPLYRGEFTIRYTQRRVYLDDAIVDHILDVLPDLPTASATLTWALDFTGYLPWLGVTYGNWTDPEAVADILSEVGIDGWDATSTVSMYAVEDRDDANPAYTHVLIQTHPVSKETIYLHYRSAS